MKTTTLTVYYATYIIHTWSDRNVQLGTISITSQKRRNDDDNDYDDGVDDSDNDDGMSMIELGNDVVV